MMQCSETWHQRWVPRHLLRGSCDQLRLRTHGHSPRLRTYQYARFGRTRLFLSAGKAVGESFLAEQQLPSNNSSRCEKPSSTTLEALDSYRSSVRCIVKIRWSSFGRLVHGLEIVIAFLLLTESLLRPQQLLFSLRVVRVVIQKKYETITALLESLELIQRASGTVDALFRNLALFRKVGSVC